MRSLHTPQQETNVAYNPGVTYRGGEFIAQGISQAGNAITAGLQRYAQNREESAALDMSFQTRAQPLLEEMQKFSAKDGQVSPAAGLVDKGADWHKFSSSQKKAFLADVVLMGDKQDRARRQQQEDDFRKAAQQFQQDQFTATEKHRRFQEGQGAINTILSGYNQYKDNARADERLTLEKTTNARVEAERAKARAKEDAFFTQAAQGYDLADKYPGVALPMTSERLAQFGASSGGISPQALINLAEFSERRNDPIARDAAETARINALASRMNAENNQPKPWWMGAAGKALPEPRDGYAALPDGRGGFTWKAQKKADGTVSAAIPAEMQTKMDTLLNEITEDEAQIAAGDTRSWYGGSRADRLKENKARLAVFQRNYGGAAAPGPASGGSRFKVEEIK